MHVNFFFCLINSSDEYFLLVVLSHDLKKPHTNQQQTNHFCYKSNQHVSCAFLVACAESVSPNRQCCPVILRAQEILLVNTAHVIL